MVRQHPLLEGDKLLRRPRLYLPSIPCRVLILALPARQRAVLFVAVRHHLLVRADRQRTQLYGRQLLRGPVTYFSAYLANH
jgi:hypothetical protein